ncbi:hypothetical protein DXG03_008442 [Asterophora parasitica]|uniref:Uncharacterized protein n=1 Tax=Asterophora parasitica TaxID=117018 RepID=A0A9P7GDS0_9AGAR|nr:hypothetical protein DXG03_008442 [Asterophora parasitica]
MYSLNTGIFNANFNANCLELRPSMSRYGLTLLCTFLVVHAHSQPLDTLHDRRSAPDLPARDLADFLEEDLIFKSPSGNGGYTYEAYSSSWRDGATFTFGGILGDNFMTRTDVPTSTGTSDISTATTSASSTTKGEHTHKATPAASIVNPTTTSSAPTPSATDNHAAEATGMFKSEAAQWKVIGLVVICITFVAAAILTVVFFDAWWGFVCALVCRRRHNRGKKDMVPDWEKQRWEYKIPEDDAALVPAKRYASPTASLENIKRQALGMGGESGGGAGLAGMGAGMGRSGSGLGIGLQNPFVSQREMMASPQPVYMLDSDPHPLAPLSRRPSANPRSPLGYA